MTTQQISIYKDTPFCFTSSVRSGHPTVTSCRQNSFTTRTPTVRKFIDLFESAIGDMSKTKAALEIMQSATDAAYVRIQLGEPSNPDLDVAIKTENFESVGLMKKALTLRQPLTLQDHKAIGEIVVSRAPSAPSFQPCDQAFLKEVATGLSPSFLLSRSLKRHTRNFFLNHIAGTEPACIITHTGLFRGQNKLFVPFAKSTNLFGPIADRLLFRSNKLQNAFINALKEFESTQHKGSFYVRHSNNQITSVEVHQIGHSFSDNITPKEALLIFRNQQHSNSLNTDLAISLFDLTPAEADVAASLFLGMKPNAIASLRGVAVSTIRSLLKSINSKLSVTSQLEAVAKLRESCQINLSLDFHHSDFDRYF